MMEEIDIGSVDALRDAFIKVNSNFADLDAAVDLLKLLKSRVFIPATLFQPRDNTPAPELAPASGHPCWTFDASVNEAVHALLHIGDQVPSHWNKFAVQLLWCSRGTNMGIARYRSSLLSYSVRDTLAAHVADNAVNVSAPGMAFRIVNTLLLTDQGLPADEFLALMVERNAQDDTLTDESSMLGVYLVQES